MHTLTFVSRYILAVKHKKMVKVFRSIGCRLKTWNYTKITLRKRTGCPGEGRVRAIYIMLFWKNWKFKLSACRLGHFTLLFSQHYSWGWRERGRGMSFKDKNITCTNTHTWLTSAFFLRNIFISGNLLKTQKVIQEGIVSKEKSFSVTSKWCGLGLIGVRLCKQTLGIYIPSYKAP